MKLKLMLIAGLLLSPLANAATFSGVVCRVQYMPSSDLNMVLVGMNASNCSGPLTWFTAYGMKHATNGTSGLFTEAELLGTFQAFLSFRKASDLVVVNYAGTDKLTYFGPL